MCGICGIINQKETVRKQGVIKMLSYLHERGPDNEGIYISDNIGLGHSRLSIIDLSAEANQPMLNDSKSVAITFNGEIYNFRLIKSQLEADGVRFKTNSDTEVILKAYEQWGLEHTLSQIDGMFALAIYDKVKATFYLARDRFGKKPLYYFLAGTTFSFSSNIKSLWVTYKEQLSLDWESIDYFLTELSTPQPKTIWQEINQLKPAHYAVLELDKFEFSERKYWQLTTMGENALTEDEVHEQTTTLLINAIKKRQLSDVPLGFFLSGGIDSGLITALAAQNSTEKIKTLTVSLEDSLYDESGEAELIASRYDTEHTNIHVSSDIANIIEELIEYIGEPFADSSLIPSFLITRAAKNDITVVISGDGGDEVFGGYDDYHLAYRSELFAKKFNSKLKKEPAIIYDKIISRFSKRENLGSLEHFARLSGGDKLLRKMAFLPSEKKNLYQDQSLQSAANFTSEYLGTIWQKNLGKSSLKTLMKSSLETRLLNDYLVKIDRASMRNSIEVRSPFLDKDLAEYAFSLNNELLFTNSESKKILRDLAKIHLGEASASRIKTGFRIPVHKWLRTNLKSWRNELIDSFVNRNILNKEYLTEIIDDFDKANNSHTNKIWAVICLELWFQKFLD